LIKMVWSSEKKTSRGSCEESGLNGTSISHKKIEEN